MEHTSTFIEIASLLALATITGIIGQKLRQPLIIMFLLTGILAGPSVLGIINSYEEIELLAHIGIALLLFIVGLKLDLNLIRTTGIIALATGMGQIIFTSLIGFLIALAFGMSFLSAAYVAVALTFSSTIIIVKLLSDKKEIDSLHGQIAIGFLIVQDIAAIIALVGLTTLGASVTEEGSAYITVILIALKGILFLAAVALLMKYVIPPVTKFLAYSQELLILFAIAWAVFLGASSDYLGFSKEVGAFLAGVSLASTAYRDLIGVRLLSLRDFLLLFFFIDLGARLDWSTVGTQLWPAMVFSLFVLIGNPIIVLIIMGLMGYRRRTSFLAGLVVAQISEFSLIVAALGLSIGHIDNETMGLITLVGVVTIFISTYMILYSEQLYRLLSESLKIFERKNPFRESALDTISDTEMIDVVLVGLGNYGSGLCEYILRRNKILLGVDFDPGVLDKWRKRGVSVIYGDMTNPEMLDHLPLNKTRWIISTVRSKEINLSLLNDLKKYGYNGKVALTAINEEEANEFKSNGANIVFCPFKDAAEQAADALTYAMDFLPENINWPISFAEVRIRSDAFVAGQEIRELPLSSEGISILAISRGGGVYYELTPDFRIFPGDRLLLMGPPARLKEAETLLNKIQELVDSDSNDVDHFEILEIAVSNNSELAGKSLKEINFRQRFSSTLVGIRRNQKQITNINPSELLQGGDNLIVIGKVSVIRDLKNQEPL